MAQAANGKGVVAPDDAAGFGAVCVCDALPI